MGRIVRMIVLIMTVAVFVQAGEQSARLMTGEIARKILEQAYNYLEAQPAFSLKALTINEDSFDGKLTLEVRHRLRVDLDRNGRILVEIDGESKHRTYLLDRGKFVAWDRPANLYGELSVPGENDAALDYLYDRYGMATPLANLLYSDLRERLMPQARGYYFGIRKLRGIRCHYLVFNNRVKELELWIQARGAPLIRRFVVIDKTTELRLHSATDIDWLSVGKVEGEPFAFHLPPNARRIPIEASKEKERR